MTSLRGAVAGAWGVRLLVAALSLVLIGGAAMALQATQSAAHRGVEDRFAAKAGLTASFVSTYVSQLSTREQLVGTTTMSGPDPSAAFVSAIAAFGFRSGVVLDSEGRALSISPYAAQLIGVEFRTKYAHLASALQGQVAVSGVVTSAVRKEPVIAFAVPFETPQGRRVFSGAYAVSDTPLVAFLRDVTTLQGAELYLTDNTGTVIASNTSAPANLPTLATRNPALFRAAAASVRGGYASGETRFNFAKTSVPGTSWSLIIAAPSDQIFTALNGTTHWLPWAILGGLSLLMGLAGLLAVRLVTGRRRLARMNGRLSEIARTDALTGLSNRLHLTEQLDGVLANSRRYGFPVTVLMIDVDNFKRLNDTYGHHAGDQALRHVAERLSVSLREGDMIARWGGEEFLAVLPYSDLMEGVLVAERLCNLVSSFPIEMGAESELIAIHASVGVAQAVVESLDALVQRADLGLYEAKAAGRNTVRAAAHPDPAPLPDLGSDPAVQLRQP